jgi:hypothetical protein
MQVKITRCVFLLTILAAAFTPAQASGASQAQEPVYNELAASGKKCRIGEDYSFVYEFAQTPKMGTAILRVRLFDGRGDRTTELTIKGQSDMPTMRGAHDSGEVLFRLNQKGDYLLPVDIVMPGEWEVRLVFLKGEEVIYRGFFRFNV